jgi:DNA-binding GntR family transcriptional regulator
VGIPTEELTTAPVDRTGYAYARLREAIVSGKLSPGTRLIEVDLARELQISRTPVREALLKLVGDGLVSEGRGRPLAVAEFPEQRIRDLFVMRAALEGAATRLASQRITEAELAELDELVRQMELSLAQPGLPNFADLNVRFHLLVHQIGANAILTEQLDNLFAGLRALRAHRSAQYFLLRLDADRVAREHRAILLALATHDGEVAELVAKRHVENALPIWLGQ